MLLRINSDTLAEKLYLEMHSCLNEISNNKLEIWNKDCDKSLTQFGENAENATLLVNRIPNFIGNKIKFYIYFQVTFYLFIDYL